MLAWGGGGVGGQEIFISVLQTQFRLHPQTSLSGIDLSLKMRAYASIFWGKQTGL